MRLLERIVALLLWCSSVFLSLRLSGMGMHCDHTVHFSADLSLWLDSPMFWAPWHQSMPTYSQVFSSSTWKTDVVWMCKLGEMSQERLKIEVKLLLDANRKSYMLCRLAQQRMILSDLEWPFLHRALSLLKLSFLFYAWVKENETDLY